MGRKFACDMAFEMLHTDYQYISNLPQVAILSHAMPVRMPFWLWSLRVLIEFQVVLFLHSHVRSNYLSDLG